MKRLLGTWFAALVVGGSALFTTAAEAAWPERPITIVVPYTPGGTADVLARRFSRELTKAWGQPEWLAAARFTVADIMMADALRMPNKHGQLGAHDALGAYVARACARPAFQKAHRDQLAHFAAADASGR